MGQGQGVSRKRAALVSNVDLEVTLDADSSWGREKEFEAGTKIFTGRQKPVWLKGK